MKSRRTFLHLATGAAVLPVVIRTARAQTYPARALTMIVAQANKFDMNDAKLAETVRSRVATALYRYASRGEVINRNRPDGTRVWRLAP